MSRNRSLRPGACALALVALLLLAMFPGCSRSDPQDQTRQAPPDVEGAGAAGVCDESKEDVPVVRLKEDAASPRCLTVRGGQRLRVVNEMSQKVSVSLGGQRLMVPAMGDAAFSKPFGDFLKVGGHTATASLHSGKTYGFEIRLVA